MTTLPPKNQPLSGNAMPRFGGPATMMRLPSATSPEGLDAAFIGVPLDTGTSHRPGARFGPRQIRAESALLVGHNPGISELAQALARNFEQDLPTGAVVAVDLPVDTWGAWYASLFAFA